MLEDLRRSLHNFAHLTPEGDTDERKQNLDHLLSSNEAFYSSESGNNNSGDRKTMDELFRCSGSLKPELKAIITALGDPRLMYNDVLSAVIPRLDLIVSSLDLEDILQDQVSIIDSTDW